MLFGWVITEEIIAFIFHLAFTDNFGIWVCAEKFGGQYQLFHAVGLHVMFAQAGIRTGSVKTEAVLT